MNPNHWANDSQENDRNCLHWKIYFIKKIIIFHLYFLQYDNGNIQYLRKNKKKLCTHYGLINIYNF